jgi:hypothetical protein
MDSTPSFAPYAIAPPPSPGCCYTTPRNSRISWAACWGGGGRGALTRGNFALRRCPISGSAPKAAVGPEPREREGVQLLQPYSSQE